MNYLAFDLGGSSGKLMLGRFASGRLSLQKIHQFENSPVSVNGNLYWDIINIYSELCAGIKKAVSVTGDDIACIGFDSFCNDFALVSEKGELLGPVYCYRDKRTIRCEDHTFGIMTPKELYRINGNQNAPFNTLRQLDAMCAEGRNWQLEHCHKLLFISDLFIQLLTGRFVTEYTTASVTQMYDYAAGDWSAEILKNFKIRKSLFAPLVPPGTIVGPTTDTFRNLVSSKGFQVSTVCQHDTASAFLASVYPKNCAIISTGTWCLVGMETDTPRITQKGYQLNIANEGGYEKHHRLLKNVMGTWIIQEIAKQLAQSGHPLSYEELDQQALQCGACDIFIDVDAPIFYQPGQMMDKVNAFCEKHFGRRPGDIGEMILCVYKSLAFKYRFAIEKLEEISGTALPVINMIGGGSKSSLMCQITADVCRRPVTAGPADATALGNLLVQMLANGEISSVSEGREIIRSCTELKEYQPNSESNTETDYQNFVRTFHIN